MAVATASVLLAAPSLERIAITCWFTPSVRMEIVLAISLFVSPRAIA